MLKKLQSVKENKNKLGTLYKKTRDEIQHLIASENIEDIIDALEENKKVGNNKPLSPMIIDEDYKIFLPNYGIEIQLSHLTKTVYIFFLKHPKGIYLPQLKEYEKDILNLYKGISYQNSLEKMERTISNLVNFENNEIYTHISRIKREFFKKLPKEIASQYCIEEKKEKLRGVSSSCFPITFEFVL